MARCARCMRMATTTRANAMWPPIHPQGGQAYSGGRGGEGNHPNTARRRLLPSLPPHPPIPFLSSPTSPTPSQASSQSAQTYRWAASGRLAPVSFALHYMGLGAQRRDKTHKRYTHQIKARRRRRKSGRGGGGGGREGGGGGGGKGGQACFAPSPSPTPTLYGIHMLQKKKRSVESMARQICFFFLSNWCAHTHTHITTMWRREWQRDAHENPMNIKKKKTLANGRPVCYHNLLR